MLVKILGMIDLFSVFVIFFSQSLPPNFITTSVVLLFFKGSFYGLLGDGASYLDMLCAAYVFTLTYGSGISILTTLSSLFLLQKGVLSVLA